MKKNFTPAKRLFLINILLLIFLHPFTYGQGELNNSDEIDVSGFYDSAHHWYDITDHDQAFLPLKNQKRYKPSQVKEIADNVLLYQQKNGGWPKNYDMLAILTNEQKEILKKEEDSLRTTFDNGATYSQIEYLAKAFSKLKDEKYKSGVLKGINFILSAQYANDGWPQFYPDTSGYRKYITFNDDAMIGVLKVLHEIVQNKPYYSFVNIDLRGKVKNSLWNGIDCILKCQIKENGKLTIWCQQHDNIDFHPVGARTFELASKGADESVGVVLFLMNIDNPNKEIINSIESAVNWFSDSKILGIKVKIIKAPKIIFKYRKSTTDKIVVRDSSAAPVWARFYTLKTNKPFFSDRNGKPFDSLSEIGRERRDGYRWYTYAPQKVLDKYESWKKKYDK